MLEQELNSTISGHIYVLRFSWLTFCSLTCIVSSCRFMNRLLFILPNLHGEFRNRCLDIVLTRIDTIDNVYIELKSKGLQAFLTHRSVIEISNLIHTWCIYMSIYIKHAWSYATRDLVFSSCLKLYSKGFKCDLMVFLSEMMRHS